MRESRTNCFSTAMAAAGIAAASVLAVRMPDLRLGREMNLAYGAVAVIGACMLRLPAPLGLLWIWAAVVFWIHPMTPAVPVMTVIVLGAGILFVAGQDVRKERLYDLVALIALANVAWQIGQLAAAGFHPAFQHLWGLMGNVDDLSVLYALCLPAFFRRGWRKLTFAPISGLLMCQCMMGVCASAVCAILAWSMEHRAWSRDSREQRAKSKEHRAFKTLCSMLLLLPLLLYARSIGYLDIDRHMHGRLPIWREVSKAAMAKPVAGWGAGQFKVIVPLLTTPALVPVDIRHFLYESVEDKAAFVAYANGLDAQALLRRQWPKETYFEAHNEYIEMLFAAGLPGLALLLWACGSILRRGWRQPDRIPFYGFLAACVSATAFFTWQVAPLAALTVLWAGLILRQQRAESTEHRENTEGT